MARRGTMAATKGRRLKVFQAQFGFYDSVVAASSQAAALRAWGTHQNLFADGQATVTTDAAAVEAALAQPETPLRRPVGSQDAFKIEPSGLPSVPDLPKSKTERPRVPPQPALPPKPAPDRSALDAAERAVTDLDAARRREESAFRQRQDELDVQIIAAREAYLRRRKAAKATLATAREAYREAGGED